MSSNVGRNSLIMASGTMASRITGQVRTILLAACLGTTGIAANAYQTGSMIPQVLFTVISGGIFNAVLVPQIVRTLKAHDAQERLNKLITLAVVILLAMTLLMMAATPLLTLLYLNSSWDPAQRALVNAFTLWCMPQIFFYGLYTVLGQILAAQDKFTAYAWSSVGANVISCAGFTVFLVLFGPASRQPLQFWDEGKIFLTAGTWTIGVAFQALILFVPLMRSGLKYRPQWGVSGIGLKAMGPVAAWSMGVMGMQEITNIVNARISNGAPFAGGDLYGIAGNGSYQNAFTLYILPYSLIATSVATAIFPKISRAVADRDMDGARTDLSGALRNVLVLMMFFTMAILVMPVEITIALLPSVSVPEAQLIAGPMMALTIGLPATSAYLLIQRTFYAFEDGRSPFLFQLMTNTIQIVIEVGIMLLAPPQYWTAGIGLAISLSYLLSFPFLVVMLRKRFDGRLDGRRIASTGLKTLVAAVVAGVVAKLLSRPIEALLGSSLEPGHEHLNWMQAFLFCAIVTAVTAVVYAVMLMAVRCEEFTALSSSVLRRVTGRRDAAAAAPAPASSAASSASEAVHSDDAGNADIPMPQDASGTAPHTPRTVSSHPHDTQL
ncbi:murein biosynthesis integral membrane protein MurJ [Bifidobacterium saguinibicoloris]|uniref:murein biosynthesis integral membrane protein MurJ n=1 Tax=Bifidobacterium saguinibicoloris TaxID=2834433 RepID=UPI001C57335B|nr:murein biosynthesis integral membrane protein MurJ [Bifidobacterium saguinibicoloris]MBW3081381.1 murein biosynthesis integral membrane protein MurJ [Bifidobacterium saguinibicoloris]